MLKLPCKILFICFISLSTAGHAQDAFFSQFYTNRLYLNPSLAGIGEAKRVFLNYRNQYPGIGSIYKSYSLSYDQHSEFLKGGFGFSLSNDVQGSGDIGQLKFSGIYSYQLKAGRYLSFSGGLEASVLSRSINAAGFVFGDQYNPTGSGLNPGSESYGNINKIFPDFSGGASAFYKNFYGGISMSHLLRPYQSESSLPESRLARKFILFAGNYFSLYEKRLGKEVLQVNPNFIYIQQKNLSQLIYGLEGLYKDKYVAGLWIRQNLGLKYSALIFSMGISLQNIHLRYSYDAQFSLPSVQIPGMGAHEISMVAEFGENKKIKHKAIKCPKF
ncbi:MAG: PorP/SprF family type IX secretion system membrane protein [Bacteroidales bacterium]|nr:PorP/SprF family type IX secretion system membrane protein [Bacteroidales bacterium]